MGVAMGKGWSALQRLSAQSATASPCAAGQLPCENTQNRRRIGEVRLAVATQIGDRRRPADGIPVFSYVRMTTRGSVSADLAKCGRRPNLQNGVMPRPRGERAADSAHALVDA